MRIFVQARQIVNENLIIRAEIEKINGKLIANDQNVERIFNCLDQLVVSREAILSPRKRIGFKPDDI